MRRAPSTATIAARSRPSLINHGEEPFRIARGMKIAQMVIARHEQAEVERGLRTARQRARRRRLRFDRPSRQKRHHDHAETLPQDFAGAGGGDRHRLQCAPRTGAGQGNHRAPGRAAALSGTGDAATGARRHSQRRARPARRLSPGPGAPAHFGGRCRARGRKHRRREWRGCDAALRPRHAHRHAVHPDRCRTK